MLIRKKPKSRTSRILSSTNTSGIADRTEPIVAYDDYEGEWQIVKSKSVQDSDGFWTDYTMWFNETTGQYVFVFGDNDLYDPDNSGWDWECDSEAEADEWFEDYEGFSEDEEDDIFESSVESSMRTDNPVEWIDANEIVRKMYNKFPDFEFIDERDIDDNNVALYFKLGASCEEVEDYLKRIGADYKIYNGKLRIIAPEVSYYDQSQTSVDECDSIMSSSNGEEAYLVTFGWDEGGPESGPIWKSGTDIMYATSEDEACSKWEAEYSSQFEGNQYGGYEGCWARKATPEEVEEHEEGMRQLDEEDKWLRENGYIQECDSVTGSAEFFDKGDNDTYWYFTKHGVMPGSVPRGLDILDVVERPEGSYFLTNRVLTTDALRYYDIKERAPRG